jgi:Winged helix-turn helix
MRGARPVEVNSVLRKAVERLARGRSMPAQVVECARIVLRAADGLRDKQIAQELGMTAEKAARWRNPFLDGGIAALQKDAPRPGRTRTITEDQVKRVVETTIGHKPANATHWSAICSPRLPLFRQPYRLCQNWGLRRLPVYGNHSWVTFEKKSDASKKIVLDISSEEALHDRKVQPLSKLLARLRQRSDRHKSK